MWSVSGLQTTTTSERQLDSYTDKRGSWSKHIVFSSLKKRDIYDATGIWAEYCALTRDLLDKDNELHVRTVPNTDSTIVSIQDSNVQSVFLVLTSIRRILITSSKNPSIEWYCTFNLSRIDESSFSLQLIARFCGVLTLVIGRVKVVEIAP